MEEDNHIYAVIMAGGGGTRLWPVSRRENPKQLLSLFGGKSLFEIAVERLADLFLPDHILVVTVADQAEKLQTLVPSIPFGNYLIEPLPRGTAAVVALGAAAIHKRDPQGVMVVLTADHFIENIKSFHEAIRAACQCAKQGQLVTLGIRPTFPSTGYGYIEIGDPLGEFDSIKTFKVARFEEKPDENRAVDFIKSGRYLWNSGMFIWNSQVILDEIILHMPELAQAITGIDAFIDKDHAHPKFLETWTAIKPQTIDYGIMEKSQKVSVIPVKDIGWNDVGCWDSLFEVLPPDENGNILLGEQVHPIESRNSLVFSEEKNKLVIPLGVQNMIIVNTPDALLICPRGDSQKVKMLVDYLKQNHFTLFM